MRDPSLGKGAVSDNEDHVLATVVDKVVQDADDTEGTGTWSVSEASRLHVSAPSIAASHFMRLASADRAARLQVASALQLPSPPECPRTTFNEEQKSAFVEDVRQALYGAFLASFAQGLQLIARQSDKEGWGVSLSACLKIWRAGCIISSDGLATVFEDVARDFDQGAGKTNGHANGHANGNGSAAPNGTSRPKDAAATIPAHPRLASALAGALPALRRTLIWGLERDASVPTLGASLEWTKYIGARMLPTMFMEAELDLFGAHRYDKWDSEAGMNGGEVKKGAEHFEWKPA